MRRLAPVLSLYRNILRPASPTKGQPWSPGSFVATRDAARSSWLAVARSMQARPTALTEVDLLVSDFDDTLSEGDTIATIFTSAAEIIGHKSGAGLSKVRHSACVRMAIKGSEIRRRLT